MHRIRRVRTRRVVARSSKSFHTNLMDGVSRVERRFLTQLVILKGLLNGAIHFSVKQQENWDMLLKYQEGWDKLLKDQDEKWDKLLKNQDGHLEDQRAHWVIQKAHWVDHKAYWEGQQTHTTSLDSHLTAEKDLWTTQRGHMKDVGDNWTKLYGHLENIHTKLAGGETGFARNFYQSATMVMGNTVNTFVAMLGVWLNMTPHLTTEEKKERTYVMIASGSILVAFLITLQLVVRVQRSESNLMDKPWFKFFKSSSFSLAFLAPLLTFKALTIPGVIPAIVLFVVVVLLILAPQVGIDIW